MSELIKMIVAGVLFGCWPLLMNRSGLTGMSSALVFVVVNLLFVAPIALKIGVTAGGVDWRYAIAAPCVAGLGLVVFSDGLAKATPTTVGRLFVIMTVVQITVPAIYHTIMNGHIALKTGLGFATAIITAILLI